MGPPPNKPQTPTLGPGCHNKRGDGPCEPLASRHASLLCMDARGGQGPPVIADCRAVITDCRVSSKLGFLRQGCHMLDLGLWRRSKHAVKMITSASPSASRVINQILLVVTCFLMTSSCHAFKPFGRSCKGSSKYPEKVPIPELFTFISTIIVK